MALTPANADGLTRWSQLCSSENATLVEVCQEVFPLRQRGGVTAMNAQISEEVHACADAIRRWR